jgi:exodeoxyribonuclease VII large subunit
MVIWEVSQVNRYVRRLVEEDASLRDLWVAGEVSNFTVAMSGHAYFTLKDSTSQLRCVMFRQYLARIRRRPENGEVCVARGPLRVYEPQGAYQLNVEFVAPAGLGELQLRLEALKAKLESEGLFEPSRKRPLPAWPRRIGVVTSATGAVLHDIRTIIARRWPLAEIILAAAPVQGDDAPPRICQALADLDDFGSVEVIIVARGGGSAEDLWPFNDEAVARSVFASRAPVVSAIGHETDETIVDLVADHRAPTPSAAAELVVPDIRDVRGRLQDLATGLCWHARRHLERAELDLDQLHSALERSSPVEALVARDGEVRHLASRASRAALHHVQLFEERLRARELQLAALDPLAILRRGYGLTWQAESGAVVRGLGDVHVGMALRTRVVDGTYDSEVIRT